MNVFIFNFVHIQDYMAAFNFASEEEALTLKNHLIEKIELRKQRREGNRNSSQLLLRNCLNYFIINYFIFQRDDKKVYRMLVPVILASQ